VLIESARIARGVIRDLATFRAEDAEILIFPGGFGAAKNLSNFAFAGADCTIDPTVVAAIQAMAAAGKPIGALCIAPVLLASVVKGDVTIGNCSGTAQAVEALGGKHQNTTHGEVVIDRSRKLATSPCYMLNATISQIAEGAENTVKALIALATD
jgi:enhancing lycopene biosynthesis protein 2